MTSLQESRTLFTLPTPQVRTDSEDPSGDDHLQRVTASRKPPRSASGPGPESNSAVPVCRPLPGVSISPNLERPAATVRTIASTLPPPRVARSLRRPGTSAATSRRYRNATFPITRTNSLARSHSRLAASTPRPSLGDDPKAGTAETGLVLRCTRIRLSTSRRANKWARRGSAWRARMVRSCAGRAWISYRWLSVREGCLDPRPARGRRKLQQLAGRVRASTVACRDLTPDPVTAIQSRPSPDRESSWTGRGSLAHIFPFWEVAPEGTGAAITPAWAVGCERASATSVQVRATVVRVAGALDAGVVSVAKLAGTEGCCANATGRCGGGASPFQLSFDAQFDITAILMRSGNNEPSDLEGFS